MTYLNVLIAYVCLCLGNSKLNCLMYADDLVLLSETASGLQNCLDATGSFCSKWGLNINYSKSKVMVFNKASKFSNLTFRINYTKLECGRELKYLGIVFSLNGSFTRALNDLYQRGQKTFFKLTSLFKHVACRADKFLYLCDHTVEPGFMYGAEVVGMFSISKFSESKEKSVSDMYIKPALEKLNNNICKYLLGVNKRTSNIAVFGELGRFPVYRHCYGHD